jgi:parallel beta-helix repeat protein
MLTVSWKLSVRADSSSIYIKPDGSIDPPSTPIQRIGDRYTFMNNITGFIFVQRDNIFIDGNGFWLQGNGDGYGFDLTSRSNVTITNCTIASFLIGVHVYFSSDMFLLNNHVKSNVNGLQIINSNGSYVLDNSFTHNGGDAVWLDWSTRNNISGNFVADNHAGVMIIASSVIMKNNSISRNNYNFGVDGEKLSHFIIDVDTSNTVNNKPIYYWVNKQDMEVPFDAGYVAVINSTNITIKNLTLANNYDGVLSCFNSNLTIQNVSLFYNNYGIISWKSSNSSITGCDTEAGYCGIWLQDSSNSSITRSRIINNRYGIKLIRSSDNRIYHNNFLNNVKQADTDAESISAWDDGYPSGGNYWSDYTGVDLNSGLYQNVTGSDGIGDTPYPINADNKDNYPLMEPWSPPEDKTAPTIETPSCTPSGDVPLNQEVTVTVNVTDTESRVKNVTLSYKLGNTTSWTSLPMSYNTTTGLYETIIPSQLNATSVSFKITAFDNAGNMATEDNAGEYYVYNVIPEFTLIALLSFIIVLTLIIVYAKRKSVGTKSPSAPVRKCA